MAVISKEDIKSALSESSSKKKQQKYFIDGKWRTADWLKDWQKSIATGGWKPEQVLQLQIDLGLGEKHQTGVYDKTTRSAHTEFLKENTNIRKGSIEVNRFNYGQSQAKAAQAQADSGNWVATEQGVVKMSSDAADKYSAEQEYQNMVKQRQQERSSIQDDMFNTWKQLTGVTASEANVNWATDRVLAGWGYDDFFFWMKDRPEMKKMYPGMPSGMQPSEYIDQRHKLNSAFMEAAGRPLSHEEIAQVMKGGDFPDVFFLGQPAVSEQELSQLG